MENFLQLCQQRFSLRAYKSEKVPAEVIDYIMECVRMAPSAVNKQPWRFRLLTSAEDLCKAQQCYNRSWFATAPACFLVCRHRNEEWVRSADGKPHGDIDVAIAITHLALAATEQGLPAELEPVALVPIGYPAEGVVVAEKNRKPVEELFF